MDAFLVFFVTARLVHWPMTMTELKLGKRLKWKKEGKRENKGFGSESVGLRNGTKIIKYEQNHTK